MIRHLLVAWFAWPDGGVWSNLAASAITGTLTFAAVEWRARVHLSRLHAHLGLQPQPNGHPDAASGPDSR